MYKFTNVPMYKFTNVLDIHPPSVAFAMGTASELILCLFFSVDNNMTVFI